MIVAILLPTTGRPEQMKERVTELVNQDMPKGVTGRVYLAIPKDDKATLKAAEKLEGDDNPVNLVERNPGTTAVQGWNAAFVAAHEDGADWFVLGADDIKWHPGWLENALALAERGGAQVIGLHDGHTNLNHYGAHYMVSREFAERHLGGVFIPPMYGSWWFDREVCEKAAGLGLYAACWEAVAEHLHPDWSTAPMDATYEKGYALHGIDGTIYTARKADGFPVDYPSLLEAAEAVKKAQEEADEKPVTGKKMKRPAEDKMRRVDEDKGKEH
jgi:hypothetical protein